MALIKSTFLLLAVYGFYAAAQKQNYKCDFEKGICPFLTNDKSNRENWKIGKGKVNAADTGPSIDHTLGNANGSYIYVNVSAARTNEVKLQTVVLRDGYCIKFFYHMYGADVGDLTVRTMSVYASQSVIYFKRSRTQGDRWKEAAFFVTMDAYMRYQGYRVIFSVKNAKASNILGDIALDDVELNSGKCPDTKREAEQMCSFDYYNCGYSVSLRKSSLNWEWQTDGRSTTYLATKPSADHTLGTPKGGYWFVGSSSTSGLEQVTLSSPSYKQPKQTLNCLHFYYFLESKMTGSVWNPLNHFKSTKEAFLQAYVTYTANDRTSIVTKAKNTTIHNKWTYVEAKVNITKASYKFEFIAGIESSLEVTLALDDVKLFSGNCPEAGFCDFEEDKCTWTDGEGDFNWLRKDGKSRINQVTGPAADNSLKTENGHYVVISTQGKQSNSEANLESELFPPSDDSTCLSFYFYMSGQDVGALKALRQEENITESTIWIMKNSPLDRWRKGMVLLRPTDYYNKVIFKGIIGSGKDGYMALDDIRFRKGEKCDLTPSEADPRFDAVSKLSCTFDDQNLCLWKQVENTLTWKFGNVSLFESTGPKQPVNGKGHYIFVSSYEGDQSNNEKIARIQSPVIASFYPEPACFSFYFHMFGAHVGELRVIIVPMQNENNPLGRQVIWRRRGTQPDKWLHFKDSLSLTEGDYRLEIEAEGGAGFAGDIAIDEVMMTLGQCQNQQDMCDFESSECGWKIEPSKSATFYWRRGSGFKKGPERDHTTRSVAGYYLQATAEDNAKTGDVTYLVSQKYGKNWGPHCLTFWYYRPGLGTGEISVITRISGKDTMAWHEKQDVGKFWHYGQVNVNQKKDFQLAFKAEKGFKNDYEMALDDILIKNSACGELATCDFNNDYCSYFQNETSDFAWLLGTGRVVNTQLINNPPEDNSVKNGMYLYADMTSPSLKEGQTATLVSEILESTATQVHCLSFSFYITGADKSYLNVGKMTLDNTDKDMQYNVVLLLTKSESTGNGWAPVHLDVPSKQAGDYFQLYFSATKGNGSRSMIAIDDITVTENKCKEPTTEPPVVPTEMPDTLLSCNFDSNSFCSWKAENGDIKFQISVPTKTKDRMPKFDHTKGNYLGRYAYVQGDNLSVKKASLTLKAAPAEWNGNFCFSFWYIMNVEGKNILSVQVAHKSNVYRRADYVTFWSKSGNYAYRWRHAYVTVKSSEKSPKMRFYAELKTGVIALDDLAAKSGPCPPPKMCTFDDDNMCNYTQDSRNSLNWDVKTGEDDGLMSRMPDHTTQTIEGSYLYIGYNGTSTETSQRSRIYSPKHSPTEISNCVTFYYHIYNVSKLSFNTYLATDNGLSDPQWTVSIGQGLLWHGARFTVSPKSVSWQVVFEVSVGSRGYGQVAIDDVSITGGRCPDPGYCDFESENCLWENVRAPYDEKNEQYLAVQRADVPTDLLTDDFDWVRHIGEDYFGPSRDKTLGSPQGFYLLMDPRYVTAGQKAVYMSERLQSMDGACLKLWYAIPNYNNGGYLQVFSSADFKTASQEKLIKGSTQEEWKESLISIMPPVTSEALVMSYWIFLAGYAGNHTLGYVAIDDIRVGDGLCEDKTELFDCGNEQHVLMTDVCNFHKECTNGKDEANCADCDFESSQCGWTIPPFTSAGWISFRWLRSRAGTERISVDHTKKDSSGIFMLAAATPYMYAAGLTANLQTVDLRNAFSTCSLEFWYNLLGKTQLKVNLNRNNKTTEIWIPPSYSSDLWTLGEVLLGRIPRNFQLTMTAERSRGEDCHAAIDDVVMRGCETSTTGGPGMCSSDQFNCKNSRCISKDNICDYTDDCGNFADESQETCESAISRCSFDRSMCDWISDNTTSASFLRRAPFESLDQGPTRDHTTGSASGNFLYLGGRLRSAPARLFGPLLQPAEGCQIRFYYDIRGNGPLSLQIKTRTAYDGEEKVVYSREDPTEGYFFVEERVTFEEQKDFQVIIEASMTSSAGKVNYIALDDISFSYKCLAKLPPFPTSPPIVSTPSPTKRCEFNEFRCKTSNKCIPIAQKCNFFLECPDGSDEDHCGQCDFHEDMCGLVNIGSGSSYRWQRVQAEAFSLVKNSTAPDSDSQGNQLGYFAVLSGTRTNFFTATIMRTPPLGETAHACKVEFYYHFNIRVGSLEVYVSQIGIGRKVRVFFQRINTGKKWQFVSVPIGNYKAGRVIEYHGASSYSSLFGQVQDIAIDHINYVDCDPNQVHDKPLDCDFDNDECGWHPDNSFTKGVWTRAKTSPQNYGPRKDHTGKGGYFMYLRASTYLFKGDKAHLVSLKQKPTEKRCFSFWYHMYGQDVGTLNIIIKTDNENSTIWSKTNSQGNAWKQGMRTIRSKDDPYIVIFEGIVGSFARPVIAIDDIVVTDDICPHPVACDFEADFCEWTAENWGLQTGKGKIPSVDHTTETNTGQYAVLTNTTGKLISPDYNYTQSEYCLNFWYFLEGDHETQLKVLKSGEKNETVRAYVAETNVKGDWMHSRASIMELSAKDKIVILGKKVNLNTVVAVDDVAIENDACPPYGSCTFERDFCTWRNLKSPISSGLQWIRNSGSTLNQFTGPSVDVTTNSTEGWYIYMDGNYGRYGQTAVLESENLHYAPKACFKFWYHMYGWGSGALEVVFVNHTDSKVYKVMKIAGNQGNNWYQVKRLVQDLPPTYRIRFIGSKGTSGDLALDDIFIQSESCADPITTTPAPTEFPKTNWDCDFEAGDFCNWENGESWKVQDGRKALNSKMGPTIDHTRGDTFGYYAYFNPKNDSGIDLMSPSIDTENIDYCFKFWYYMHSPSPVTLELHVMQYNQITGPLWLKKTSSAINWKYATYYLEKSVNMSLIMRATRSKLNVGDIALDDFAFNSGKCPIRKGHPCDFESADICGFKVESPDGITWRRMQAKKVQTGPLVDKTYSSSEGHYIILTPSTTSRVPGDNKAYLIMPNVPSTGIRRSCVRFWYQMSGENVIALNLYMRTPGGGLPSYSLWSTGTKYGNDTWRVGQRTIDAPFIHEVIFEGVAQRGNLGFIALDDVVVKDGSCPPPGSCDFEEDMCTWQNADSDVDLEWIRNSGPTPTNGTGPDVDTTLGNKEGTYIYLQGDKPIGEKSLVGILQSEYFSASSDRCLSFWAHMNGEEMGSLSVNVSYYDENQIKSLTKNSWIIRGHQGKDWFVRRLSISASDLKEHDEYQILFIGRINGKLSDIAIDDIDVSNKICYEVPDEGFDCRDGNYVNASKVCDFEKDCKSGEDEMNCGACDFEHDTCGWRDLSTSFYQPWKRVQGVNGINTNGPGYDHTFNTTTGYFMLADTQRSYWSSQQSVLQSPNGTNQFKKSYASCTMKFYYAIKSKTSGTLRIRKHLASSTIGTVWERVGPLNDNWQLGTAYLSTTERPFYIELLQMSSYENTYVAVDDITFENCSLPEKRDKCGSNEFQCKNSRCVSRYFLCDLADDCGDNSDEDGSICLFYPKPCTFEAFSDCEWTVQGKKGRNFWSIQFASSGRYRANSGPLSDHTKGIDNNGKYLVLKRNYYDNKIYDSLYQSPNYQVSGATYCALRFFYYMYGADDIHLKVYTETEQDGWSWKERFSEYGSLGQMWNRAVVNVWTTDAFHFIIEGNAGNVTGQAIAIDDISLTQGCKLFTGELPTPSPTPLPTRFPCKSNEFHCKSGQCIPQNKACDFAKDCPDGSDETDCGPCNFEKDFCGWDNQSPGIYKWDRKNASYSDGFGPAKDHKNSSEGWYAYVVRSWGFFGRPAVLVSPPLPPTSTHCVMSLWLYSSSTSGDFYIEHKLPFYFSYFTNIMKIPAPSEGAWRQYEVRIPETSMRGSVVRINSLPSWYYFSTDKNVAIDEIDFMTCNPSELLVDCDFDDDNFNEGLCHWTQSDPGAGFKWKRSKGSTDKNFTGPTSDHTTGHGYYMYIDPQYYNAYRYARLTGPRLPMNSDTGSCFSFWYHMYGQHVGSLGIETKLYWTWLRRWSRYRSQDNKWLLGEVYLKSFADYTISIIAYSSVGNENNIAIDDLKMVDGPCPNTGICDFERDFCGWNTSYEGSSGWVRTQGSGNWSAEKPNIDHTTGSSDGFFIYLPYKRYGDLARIESPLYNNYGDICIKFWYNMFGNDIGTLAVYQRTKQEKREENLKQQWKRSGDHAGGWKLGRVSLKSLPSFYIAIEAQLGKGPLGYIALDDIHVSHGKCSDPGSCTFEIDTCGWSNSDAFADVDWVRRTGLDQNIGSGPPADWTTKTAKGHYMYAYLTGLPAQSESMLISEDLAVNHDYCLSFYFNMYDAMNSSLLVKQVLIGMGWEGVTEYSSSDFETGIWNKAEVNISSEDAGDFFQIGLTAMTLSDQDNTTGRGIAIDDVSLIQQFCGLEVTTTVIPPTTTTTFPPSKFDCDFESDFCMWENDPDSVIKWIITKGHSDNKLTRPRTDHTTHSTSGQYITLESKDYYYNQARLVSMDGIEPDPDGVCFKFWYHMYGNSPGVLYLKVRNFHDDEKSETIWYRTQSQGIDWVYEQIHISKSYAFKLVFEANGRSYGDISLDDFSLNYKSCPPRDFCDVEQDYCGFTRDPEGDFQWHRGNGSRTNGPDIDHTLGSSFGNYFYVNTSSPTEKGKKARLESGNYQPDKMCMQFWYYLYGIDVGTLEVLVRNGDSVESLWKEEGDNSEFWHPSQVVLEKSPVVSYSYIFQVTAGSAFKNGTIAIDDITVKDNCPPIGSCTFEDGMCLWTNDPDADLQWLRGSGEVTTAAPLNDTTLGNIFGTYLYVHIVRSWIAEPKPARLLSPYFHQTEHRCFNYFSYRGGNDFDGALSVYMYRDMEDEIIELQHFTKEDTGRWINDQVQIDIDEGEGKYQVIFEGELSTTQNMFIALDDITVYTGECKELEKEPPEFTCDEGKTHIPDRLRCDFYQDCVDAADEKYCGLYCDFEEEEPDPCNWKTSTDTPAIWNQTLANGSLPNTDKTKSLPNEGHYMKVSFKERFVYRGKADFTSPALIQSSASCRLFFWYYLYTLYVDESLAVFSASGHESKRTRLFYLENEQERSWQQAEVIVGRIQNRFNIGFTGSKNSMTAIIAIDEISFENCNILRELDQPKQCGENEYQCSNGNCISSELLCDFVDDCGDWSDENRLKAKCNQFPGRCDFENNDYCGWRRTQETDTSWQISKVNLDSYYGKVLVTRDHTKNTANGRFLYFSNSYQTKGRVARLSSKVIETASSSCKFRFFYTYGTNFNTTKYDQITDIGSLTVYLRKDEVNVWKSLFVAREPPGQYFEKVVIPLGDIKDPFEIIIEGKIGSTGKTGGWAVDDVSFSSGCVLSNKTLPLSLIDPTEKPVDDCNANQFYCAKDKFCIDSEKVCDFVPDCSDASDEAKCGTCSFDDDSNPTCGWRDIRGNRWKRTKGPKGNNGLVSGVTDGGYYMYVSKDKAGAISSVADLRSVDFHDASSTCEVSFYYFMSGISNSDASLKLQVQTNKKQNVLLWQEMSDQGRNWQNATVSIGVRDAGWHLDFIATHVLSKGDIAIDDIKFLLCAPPFKRKCANESEFPCLSGECIDKNLVCDFSKDCPDGSDELNCTAYLERCDFEKGDLCGWSQDPNAGLKWVVTSGAQLNEGAGPDRDHTKGDETGKFLLASKTNVYFYYYSARITSTSFMADVSGECKLRFWQHLYRSYTSSITVYLQYTEDVRLMSVNTTYGSFGDEWQRIEIPLKSKFNFHAVIEGSPSSGTKGEIAIDDISFTPRCVPVYTVITTPIPTIQPKGVCERIGQFTCDDNSCVPFDFVCDFKVDCPYGKDERSCPAYCDFEIGSTCGWTAKTKIGDGVEVNVTIAREAKKIAQYAPEVDHTTDSGDGSYLIIHSSLETETGPVDEYLSPSFRESASPCKFSLWYAANLLFMRPLITLKTTNSSIVLLSFQKSVAWKRLEIGIGRQKDNFTISINKNGGMSRYDFLALDDIEFLNCALPKRAKDICYGFRCKINKGCIDFSRVCDLTDDCGDGTDETDCESQNYLTTNFENGFGIFRLLVDERYAPLSWEIRNGSSPGHIFSRTGPAFDHTLSSLDGNYITMGKGSKGALNEKAWLVSDVLRSVARGECEMRFYYFMYGEKVNELNIYSRTTSSREFTKLWSQTNEVGNFWVRGKVIINETTPFEVLVEGKAGLTTSDVIAVDDVSFTPGCRYLKGQTLRPDGVTPIVSTTPTIPSDCKSDEFFCPGDKICIPAIQRCDFREDCADKSDEEGCASPSCDFKEGNMCGWQVEHKFNKVNTRFRRDSDDEHIFKWIAIQANDEHTQINLKNRPKTDHTNNATDGWYLLADGAPGRIGDITSLVSPVISFTNARCALDFWIYCSLYSCNLKVYNGKNTTNKVWDSSTGMLGARYSLQWTHAKALLSSATNFQVRFDAIRPYTYLSAVCLDDISFENCAPPVTVDKESQTCSGTEFMCGNSRCIPSHLMCDYHDDCLDYSDEKDFVCNSYKGRCNFDATVCGDWFLESDRNAGWTVQSPGTGLYPNLPQKDHTTGTSTGKYLSVSSGYYMQNAKPKIRSTTIDGHSKDCTVRFWYNSMTSRNEILVYKRTSYDSDGMKYLEAFSSDVNNYWHKAEVPIPTQGGKDFQIVLEANLMRTIGSINIDDISLTPACSFVKGRDIPGIPTTPPPVDDCAPDKLSCKNGKCYTHLQKCNFIDDCGDNTDEAECGTSCDFESGMCGWYNPAQYATQWVIRKAGSTFFSLGFDHTKGNEEGHYLTQTMYGSVAQIHTKPYVACAATCKMNLWYYMSGRYTYNPGNLSVLIIHNEKNNKYEHRWNRTGKTEEMKWYQASVDINTQSFFSVAIESTGGSYLTTTAVDDIEFVKCEPTNPPIECVSDEWMCKDQSQCIKVWDYCDGKYDCTDKSDEYECQPAHGDCDFDSDTWKDDCKWESKNLDIEWSRANGSQRSDTGPKRNQNPRKPGYYLFIDSSQAVTDARAGIMTPAFNASEGKCYLRFWYCMNGSPGLGKLEVLSEGENGQVFPVFSIRGHQGEKWIYAHVPVGNRHNYRVTFVAAVGADDRSDIAIDEVKFTHGCEEGGSAVIPTRSPCAKNEFHCTSGSVDCIPKSWQCDCAKDCEDGSDELNCAISCVSTADPKVVTKSTPTEGTIGTVIPQKHCDPGFKLCSDEETCIPGLLLCDGIKDCPDGSDETHGCHDAGLCGDHFYFCKDQTNPPCIARELVCNGYPDCSDGSDESLCDSCPKTFCKNEGNCSLQGRVPVCTCKPKYYHNRCGKKIVTPDLEKLAQSRQAGIGWIIGVVIGTILIIAILFIIWYKRNTNAERARLPHAIDNPTYGLNLDTLTFGELNSHMPVRHEDGAGATAIENPLYAFKSELK